MNKRISALILSLAIVMTVFVGTVPTEAASSRVLTEDANSAEVYLGSSVLNKGFEEVGVGITNNPLIAEKGGEDCWELPTSNWQNCYMFFILDKDMKSESFDGSAYTFEVDYFDTGRGFFKICYRDVNGEFQTAKLVYTNNERVWKTVTFTVYDAVFDASTYDPSIAHPENMTKTQHRTGDFVIQSRTRSTEPFSAESISIKRVKVTRGRDSYPIFANAYNNEPGGIYKWYEPKKILYTNIENTTDVNQTANMTYRLEGKRGHKGFTKTETIELAPREKKTVEVDFGSVTYCDLYEYTVGIEIKDKAKYNRKLTEVAVLKTDPDGIKNDNVYFAGHLTRYTDKSADEFVNVLKLSNSGGYRDEFQWQGIVDSTGTFSKVESSTYGRTTELMRKYNMSFIPLLTCPPTNDFFKGWNDLPKTDTQIKFWREFVGVAADYLKDITHRYELLNEPNISGFNSNVNEFWGKEYAKLAKETYDEIIKHDPEAIVGGPSLTGVSVDDEDKNTRAPSFFKEALETGMAEGIGSIVLHPYYYGTGANSFEESTRVRDIQWYKDEYMKHSDKKPEIWHTEGGISVYDLTDKSYITKGKLDSRLILTTKSYDVGDIICLYNFDKKGVLDTNREDLYGYVAGGYDDSKVWGKNYFPTEAYMMITGLNYVMAQSDAVAICDPEGQTNIKMNRYKSHKFNSDILAFWALDEEENLTLDLGCKNIVCYDAYGNSKELSSDDGIYSFAATAEPVYVVGDLKKNDVVYENRFEQQKVEYSVAENDSFEVGLKLNGENKGYKLTADVPETVTVLSEGTFDANGNGSVKLKNAYPCGTDFIVSIKVVDSKGSVAYNTDVLINSVQPVTIGMTIKKAEGKDLNKWVATAKIENHSGTDAIKGHIEMTGPEAVSKVKNIDIGVVPKGKTGEISFDLPKLVRKGQYKFEYDFISEDGNKYSFKTPLDLTIAPYAEKKPTIDGVLDTNEWAYDASMYADSGSQIKKITGWGGENDLSGKSAVMWDEENMYMYAEITDDIFSNQYPLSQHWNGDSMQVGVFYGSEGFIALGQSGTKFNEFGLALSSIDGAGAYRTMSQDGNQPSGIISDSQVAVTRNGIKTIYEAKIPWKSLLGEGIVPTENNVMGFSFLINDNDGSDRRGWIEYASGIGETKNVELFTYLTLIK